MYNTNRILCTGYCKKYHPQKTDLHLPEADNSTTAIVSALALSTTPTLGTADTEGLDGFSDEEPVVTRPRSLRGRLGSTQL